MIKHKQSNRYRIRLTTSKKHNLLGSTNSNHNYVYDKLIRYQKLRQNRLQKYLNETRFYTGEQEKDVFIKRPILSYLPSDLSLNTLNSSFYKIEDLTFTEQDSDYVNMNNNNTLMRNKVYSSSPIGGSLKSFISLTTFTESCRAKCDNQDQSTQTSIDMNEMNRLVALMDKNLSMFNKNVNGNIDADGFVNFLIDFYFKSKREEKKENVTFVEEKRSVMPPAPKILPNQLFTIQHNSTQVSEKRNDLLIDELKRALEKRNKKINQFE